MDDIRYFCNHSRDELEEHRKNHPPQQLVVYSNKLPDYLLSDPVFVNQFMPAVCAEIRKIIRRAYDIDFVGVFSVQHQRLRASFYVNSAKMFEKHKAALAQIAEARWPGISKKERDAFATKNFDSSASKSVISGYVWLASGIFDAVLRPLYTDYLERALSMLGENHEIYDVIIAELFPGRAARKKAKAAKEAAKKAARERRHQKKQAEKAAKADEHAGNHCPKKQKVATTSF